MNNLDVKKIRKDLGLTQQDFADKLGVSRNTVLNYERGETIPQSKSIILNIMMSEAEFGKKFNNLPDAEAQIENNAKKEVKEVPLIPIDALAGFGAGEFTIMSHDIVEYYKIPEFSNADFLIPVKGSSMQPKYYGGDILACKFIHSFSFFQYGVPHIITIKDTGTVVKRISKGFEAHQLVLISDNEKYQPFTITTDDIVNIAIVIGVIRVEN